MKRRQFLAAAASVTLVPGAQANPYQDAEYVRALTTRLSTGFFDHGGVPVLPLALRYAQQLRPSLTGTDRVLQSAASTLASRAAWIAGDAGRFDAAEQLGRFALALGERAADQEAQSAACDTLAGTNTACRRLDRVVMYTKRGLALQEISPERRAWLNVRLGRALALIGGQEHEARDALAHAQSFLNDTSDAVSAADLTNGIGEVLSELRAFDDAHESLDQAVTLSERHSPLVYGHGVAMQAKAALHAADPLFAADRMFVLARVVPLTSSSWMDKRVSDIVALSARWATVPEMRTAREQLSSVVPVNRA